jgi:hypothetical protein
MNDLEPNLIAEHEKRRKRLMSVLEDELDSARRTFPDFHNGHEGYAVIREEVDELWDGVKQKGTSRYALAREALQVAAMGLRFIEDLYGDEIDRM